MKAKLVVVYGGVPATEINLLPPVVLGRGRQAGIVLPHSLISRQHCEIYEVDGQLIVRDLGSMNGTLVNRTQIEHPTVLRPGDSLTVGPVTFRVDYVDASITRSDTSDETAISGKASQQAITINHAVPPARAQAKSGGTDLGRKGNTTFPAPDPSDPPSTVFDAPTIEPEVRTDDDSLDDSVRKHQ